MSRKTIELTFGEKSYTIRPLVLRQVCALSELFGKAKPENQMEQINLAREAIKVALSRDHADVDVENLECEMSDLPKHLLAIGELGGFYAKPSETPTPPAPPTA